MKLRKLARLCEHDEIKRHYPPKGLGNDLCPGGVFLPGDTLIIEKVDGEWPTAVVIELADLRVTSPMTFAQQIRQNLDALSVREAEPEVEKNQMGMW